MLRPKACGMVAVEDSADPVQNVSDDDSNDACLNGATHIGNTDIFVAAFAWVVDFAATEHLSLMHDISPDLGEVALFTASMEDKFTITATGYGSVDHEISFSGKNRHCKLSHALYVPCLSFNLMSVLVMEKGQQLGNVQQWPL